MYFKIYESVPLTLDIELFAEVNEFWNNNIFDENKKKKILTQRFLIFLITFFNVRFLL